MNNANDNLANADMTMAEWDAPRGRAFRQALLFVVRSREVSILIAGCVLFIYFVIATSGFLSIDNMGTLAQFTGATAILAAGEVMVLICRELDLSVGQVYALTPFIMYFAQQAGIPIFIGVVLALMVAGLIGLINGLVTIYLRVPSFVTTLGMLFLINGVTLTISGGFPVQIDAGPVAAFLLGGSTFSGILWALAVAIILQVVLVKTRWGLHTIAVGGNPTGASEVGIKTHRIKIGNFIICSALGGLAGIIDAFHIGSIDALAGGTLIMFMAIASAVIGGTLLTGGSGTIIGALIGAVVLSILKNGFTLAGINAYTFDIILGAAILITMTLNVHLGRIRNIKGL